MSLMLAALLLAIGQDEASWKQAKRNLDKIRTTLEVPPAERTSAVKAAGNARYPAVDREAAEAMVEMLQAELTRGDERNVSADVLDACVEVLKKLDHEEATELLLKKARSGGNWRLRAYIIMGLANHPGDSVTPALLALVYVAVGNSKPKLQTEPHLAVVALDALADRKDPSALETFHQALLENNLPWEARLAALRGIARLGAPSSIDRLIEALKAIPNEQGRLKSTLIEVLQKMTGLSVNSGDAEAWKVAWESKNARVPEKGGGTQVAPPVRPTDFFGLKTRSTKIIFVLDISGSMTLKASDLPEAPPKEDPKKPPAGPEIASSGGKPGARPIKNPDPLDPARDMDDGEKAAYEKAKGIYDGWMSKRIGARIDLLKKQVIKTLYSLDHRVWFGMIFYSTDVKDWKPQMVAATWVNKVEAMLEIEKQQANGATNTGDALLEHALKMISAPTPKGKFDGPATIQPGGTPVEVISGPDTIYLLTDGEPNAGKYAAGASANNLAAHTKAAIMNELRKLIAIRKVTIHAICIGDITGAGGADNVDADWLKSIADLTGGSFVHVTNRRR